MPADSVGNSDLEFVGGQRADDLVAGRPIGVEALDVGEHDQLLGANATASAAAAVSALTL